MSGQPGSPSSASIPVVLAIADAVVHLRSGPKRATVEEDVGRALWCVTGPAPWFARRLRSWLTGVRGVAPATAPTGRTGFCKTNCKTPDREAESDKTDGAPIPMNPVAAAACRVEFLVPPPGLEPGTPESTIWGIPYDSDTYAAKHPRLQSVLQMDCRQPRSTHLSRGSPVLGELRRVPVGRFLRAPSRSSRATVGAATVRRSLAQPRKRRRSLILGALWRMRFAPFSTWCVGR